MLVAVVCDAPDAGLWNLEHEMQNVVTYEKWVELDLSKPNIITGDDVKEEQNQANGEKRQEVQSGEKQ